MTKGFSRLLSNLVIFLFFAGLAALQGIALAEPVLVPAPRLIAPRALTQAVIPSPTQKDEQPASTGIPTVPPGDPQVPATPAPAPLPQTPPPLVPVDPSPPSADDPTGRTPGVAANTGPSFTDRTQATTPGCTSGSITGRPSNNATAPAALPPEAGPCPHRSSPGRRLH